MRNPKSKIRNSFVIFCIFYLAFLSGCSIPNLEKPECTEARNNVKEFYSFHFANDMQFTKANLKLREKFLTEDLNGELENQPDNTKDYFTNTSDLPKAFRVGTCQSVSPEKTILEIILFWKDDTRSEQKEINVEAVKQDGKWLINKVENK